MSTVVHELIFEEEHARPALREFYSVDPDTQRVTDRVEVLDDGGDVDDVVRFLEGRVRRRQAQRASERTAAIKRVG